MGNLTEGFLTRALEAPHKTAFVLIENSKKNCAALNASTTYLSYADLLTLAGQWISYFKSESRKKRMATRGEANALTTTLVIWVGVDQAYLPSLYLACARAGYCLAVVDPLWPSSTREALLDELNPFCVVSEQSCLLAGSAEDFLACPVATEDSWFLLGFTSGSSGIPKAFVRTQASWINTFAHSQDEFSIPVSVLAPGPLSHGLSFYAMAETLNHGGKFVSMARFDAEHVRLALGRFSVKTLVVVPTMLRSLTDSITLENLHPPLERVVCAGAKLSKALHRTVSACFPKAQINEYYGASELSFVSVSHPDEQAPVESVGRAFAGVEILLRDEKGNCVAAGERGEIYVRSEMLAEGYLVQGELQPFTKIQNSVSVGDIGRLDQDGYLYLIDRRDNMIVTGGLNVYPSAVQEILDSHSVVQESVVFGLPDSYWGELVCAVIRFEANSTLDTNQLRQFSSRFLPVHQIPKRVYSIDVWPKTSSGKISRKRLIDQLLCLDNNKQSSAVMELLK